MSDFDKWPAQMRQLIEAFEQVLHGQSGIPFATLLTEATRDLEALESEGAHLAEAELETKLANRTSEYTTWRSKVDAAQALGLAGIEARISALTAEQNNLNEQNLPHVQAVIADFREKGLTAVAHQQTIEETIQRQQKRLRELEREKASSATQEKKLQQQLAEWEKKKHLRQLRQDCLQTAEALHDLRQTLQQQVQANNHP